MSLTHLKRLIGSTYHSNSTLSGNLWLSNKVFKNKNFVKLNNLILDANQSNHIYNRNFLNNKGLAFLNFSESSIMWVAKRFIFLQNMNLNFQANNYFKNTRDIKNFETKDNLLAGIDEAGLNNLVLFFLNVANSNNIYRNSIEHYDLYNINSQQNLNSQKSNLQKYIIDLADQITFESEFSIAFASHFSRTLVFQNNTLIMFNAILSPADFNRHSMFTGGLFDEELPAFNFFKF